jgi:hypothetical protein
MNACDHPHGGGRGKSKGNKHPRSVYGWLTRGKRTRRPKDKDGNKMYVSGFRSGWSGSPCYNALIQISLFLHLFALSIRAVTQGCHGATARASLEVLVVEMYTRTVELVCRIPIYSLPLCTFPRQVVLCWNSCLVGRGSGNLAVVARSAITASCHVSLELIGPTESPSTPAPRATERLVASVCEVKGDNSLSPTVLVGIMTWHRLRVRMCFVRLLGTKDGTIQQTIFE